MSNYKVYKPHRRYILKKECPQVAYIPSISGTLGDRGVHNAGLTEFVPFFVLSRKIKILERFLSGFYASLLQAIDGVMSLALPGWQVMSQAPQHIRSS